MTQERWRERYTEEVERSISHYNRLNEQQSVHTVYLSSQDMERKIKEMTTPHYTCHRLKLKGSLIKMIILVDNIKKVKEFNNLTLQIPCEIDVISSRYIVDAKSLMGLFSLDLSKPVEVRFDDKYKDLAKLYFSKFEVVE